MGLYVAHLCTMFLAASRGGKNANGILTGASPALVNSSMSVGDVSESFDTSLLSSDFAGWGTLKLTIYGQQLATYAKLAGTGGAYIW